MPSASLAAAVPPILGLKSSRQLTPACGCCVLGSFLAVDVAPAAAADGAALAGVVSLASVASLDGVAGRNDRLLAGVLGRSDLLFAECCRMARSRTNKKVSFFQI